MIVAAISESGEETRVELADRLAALRALAGRRVLLLDGAPRHECSRLCEQRSAAAGPRIPTRTVHGKAMQAELENLSQRYQDIVVDTEGRDSLGSRAALIAANVAVLPADALHGDAERVARLAWRIESARLFNPSLRVVIAACSDRCADPDARCGALLLEGCIPGARLAAGAGFGAGTLYSSVFKD